MHSFTILMVDGEAQKTFSPQTSQIMAIKGSKILETVTENSSKDICWWWSQSGVDTRGGRWLFRAANRSTGSVVHSTYCALVIIPPLQINRAESYLVGWISYFQQVDTSGKSWIAIHNWFQIPDFPLQHQAPMLLRTGEWIANSSQLSLWVHFSQAKCLPK